MSSGGYRPGGGRPKGIKETKPRKRKGAPDIPKPEPTEQDKIRELALKAKKLTLQAFWQRLHNKDADGNSLGLKPLSLNEKKMMNQLAVELSGDLTDDEKVAAIRENLDPLEYMLRVMNDTKADQETRLRAAALAAPYIHPRKGEGAGKKEDKVDRAKQAGAGRFAPSKPPQLKVVGKP